MFQEIGIASYDQIQRAAKCLYEQQLRREQAVRNAQRREAPAPASPFVHGLTMPTGLEHFTPQEK